MPDIAMCSNFKCTKRSQCMRYLAVPSNRQAYGMFQQDKNGYCGMFFDVMGWNNTQLLSVEAADKRNKG